jgi:serine/threonine protein phosphatase 1
LGNVSKSRRIFIGDVHGHYDGLMQLLDAIAPTVDDQLYFLGDLIDRGPKSFEVVEFVSGSGYPCVLGNHEQLFLDAIPGCEQVGSPALQAWIYSGGHATLSSYDDPDMLFQHRDWMQTLPLYLDLGDIFLVHAGMHPDLALDEQTSQECCWIRERFHSITEPYFLSKLIITGHTITFTFPDVTPGEIAQGIGWLDIDTGAYHPKSGWLTALDIDNLMVYQVHVFERRLRTLPFDEVVTRVEPSRVAERRRQFTQMS